MTRSYKHVYLDMNALTQPHVTGIGKYCLELFHALKMTPEVVNGQLKLHPVIKPSRIKFRSRVTERLRQAPSIFGFPPALGDRKTLCYHGLDFRVPKSKRFGKVVTIHDLISFEKIFNDEKFIVEAKQNFENMLFRDEPDIFVCISEFTKKKFSEMYPQLASKARVVYLGCDHQIQLHEDDRASVLKKAVLPERFILFLGTLEHRKNASMVVKAFDLVAKALPNLHLVLAGSVGFRGDETLQLVADSKYKDRIHHLNYVSDALVDALYLRAEAFVFPSFYEGFGLPILEAMKRGCPVVTSIGSATQEIAGDGALLVDPHDVQGVGQAVHDALTKSDLRQTLINAGWNRSQFFTWAKTAAATVQAYETV